LSYIGLSAGVGSLSVLNPPCGLRSRQRISRPLLDAARGRRGW